MDHYILPALLGVLERKGQSSGEVSCCRVLLATPELLALYYLIVFPSVLWIACSRISESLMELDLLENSLVLGC